VERVQAQVKTGRPDALFLNAQRLFHRRGSAVSSETLRQFEVQNQGIFDRFPIPNVYKEDVEQNAGGTMTKKTLARGLRIGMILGVFALGFLLGTVNERYADAQKIPGVGDVLDKAGKSGGALGSVAQLGTSISEMQTHVNGLQKNLETLKTVQAALGGGK
jgi:hypothetical protein